jgi:hypothetical protein
MRRVHLRGHGNIIKRLLIHACGLNLGLLMRSLCGVGTPRGLQAGSFEQVFAAVLTLSCWLLSDSAQTGVVEATPERDASADFHPAVCSRRPL